MIIPSGCVVFRPWLSLSYHLFWYPGRRFSEFVSSPMLTGVVNYIPSECKLFVCSWYSITLHPDHLKAEAIHIDRFTVDWIGAAVTPQNLPSSLGTSFAYCISCGYME
jgi:hypothetical protein